MRSLLTLAALLLVVHAAPASAQFVQVASMPGEVLDVAVSGNIYVARDSFPTVLVYDSHTLQLLAEVSLLPFDTVFQPTAVTALTVARDGTVVCGTAPFGTLYLIRGLSAARIDRPTAFPSGDTVTRITALHAHSDDRIYFSGISRWDSVAQGFWRATYVAGSMNSNFFAFGDSRVHRVNAIAGFDSVLAFATQDSPAMGALRRGRLLLHHLGSATTIEAWSADSAATAVTHARVGGRDTFLAAGSPSGRIRDTAGTTATAVPESVVRVLRAGHDGRETTVWVGSETGMLRKINALGIQDVGIPFAGLASIIDIATAVGPDRAWMVGRGAGGSFLFYYDSTVPRVESIHFSIETGLRQPYTSDTFQPPLTSGRYFVRLKTNEKLRSAPQVALLYADGSTQNIPMAGSLLDWSAEIVIDSTRAIGTVTVSFAGADDAGNTGTIILSGGSFALRSYGRVAVANNLIRPNLGEFATVRYVLTSQQNVTARIYNMRGQMVADLSPGTRGPGEFRDVVWRGRNTDGNLVASGVYLLRFEAGTDVKATQKIMVVR